MDTRSRSSTTGNKEICGDLANAHNTDTWRSSNNVSRSFDRKHKCYLIHKKGKRTDGASSSNGSGAGLMLTDPKGKEYTYALRFKFDTMNNEAEYEALLGIYAAKQPAIKEYLQKTKETLRRFRSYTIDHVRRNQNKKADALSKLALMTFEHLTKEVLVEVLMKTSIEEKEVLRVETKEEES
ncbi:reverse transcriptase domain-containing protein [Tanacetum coccineum]